MTAQGLRDRWRLTSGSATFRWLAAGIILGLYTSRVVAESALMAWRWLYLLPLIVGCLALGLALTRLLYDRVEHLWPVIALIGYVVWPSTAPVVAVGILLLTLFLLLLLNLRESLSGQRPWLNELLVLFFSLSLYLATLSPGLLPADSGEFQLVSSVLGIAHPPGYPLYTMLGKLFTLLPFESAWSMNLFAAVCGALTLAVVAHMVRVETGSLSASWLAALTLGLSPTFWAQATTANIRSLTALFTAFSMLTLHRWGKSRRERDLLAFVLCFGLGVGHHASLGLLALPILAYALVIDARLFIEPRRWPKPLLAIALSLLPLAYLPVRSAMQPSFDPSPIRSWSDFAAHVLALGFRGDMLHYRTWPVFSMRSAVWTQIMGLQFGPWLLLSALAGVICLWRKRWRLALLLTGVWLINTLSAVTYRAPQTVEYLIPSYVTLVLVLGCGIGHLLKDAETWSLWLGRVPLVLVSLLMVVALGRGWRDLDSFCQLHRDNSLYQNATSVLQSAPEDALILSNWHQATAYWYLQQVEGLRPDIEVAYVYPEGATPNDQVWLRRIGEEIELRPVLVTNRFHSYGVSPYQFVALGDIWRAYEQAPQSLPAEMISLGVAYGEGIELLGYLLDQDTMQPGQDVEVTVYWRATEPLDRDYATFLQLVGANGVIGQGDINHTSSSYAADSLQVDTYRFPLLQHTSPDEYRLITGFYYGTDSGGWERLMAEGLDHVMLCKIPVRASTSNLPTQHPLSMRFENGLSLVGADLDTSLPDQMRLYLHWRGVRRSEDVPVSQVQVLAGKELLGGAAVPGLGTGETALVAIDLSRYDERLSVRILSSDGAIIPSLGPWHRRQSESLQAPMMGTDEWYIPLGGEMVLVGWSESPQVVTAGEKAWFYPQFLSARPLTRDYSVSLGLKEVGGAWEFKTDGTPALGMIPTLKWLSGWRVVDPRGVIVDEVSLTESEVAQAEASLAVYDAFTVCELTVLDERRARLGQGTSLILDVVDCQAPAAD